ncbi:hypothetical protein [Erythrobacter crassostreae]|uniref:Lipoprotein n=1 Tax=Erythrobacter crassostreae TaxID=2828328 RepID=A0A9X1JLC6_9SPHN|nr:hypothetical protein [Erythrobacter crassostrea]MBV7259916.1 hypothetical protein [Erythrobacter crassostrea]
MRAAAILPATCALGACGLYPFGDEGHAPSASKDQLTAFIAACDLQGAKIEQGALDGETEWVVSMGEQPQAKWDCYEEQKRQAGVMATSWGSVTENK